MLFIQMVAAMHELRNARWWRRGKQRARNLCYRMQEPHRKKTKTRGAGEKEQRGYEYLHQDQLKSDLGVQRFRVIINMVLL